jgi:hypothetical protein
MVQFVTMWLWAAMAETQLDLDFSNDRLVGTEAIAEFRGESVERTRYLIRRNVIPTYREGTRIIASRRVLIEHHIRASKGEVNGDAAEGKAASGAAERSLGRPGHPSLQSRG